MSLKVVSINIEGDKHLQTVEAFLQREKPDIVCLQELYRDDVLRIEKVLGMRATFVPLVRMEAANKYGFSQRGLFGIGMFTALPRREALTEFYSGNPTALRVFGPPNSLARALLTMDVEKDGVVYSIGTTHFTWSPGGRATEEQFRDARALLSLVEKHQNLLLCGDFNAPRGGEIYELFSSRLRDCIPADVTTTLDPNKHYAGKLDLVVDYMFAKGNAQLDGVRVEAGVSDHCAVVGEMRVVF